MDNNIKHYMKTINLILININLITKNFEIRIIRNFKRIRKDNNKKSNIKEMKYKQNN